MITKVINVEVDTGNSVQELDKLEKGFKEVDQQAEKTDSQLQKVGDNGGAIAVLDSVTGGMATRLRDAAEASKLLNFSLKGMRTALIATGIGALVVALGVVVAYWDDIVDYVTDVNGKMQKQVDIAVELGEELDFNKSILEKQRKILELQGESIDEILKAEKELLFERQKANAQLLVALQTQLAFENSKIREVSIWERTKILAAQSLGQYKLASELIAESVAGNEEERKKRKEIVDQLKAAQAAAFALKLEYVEINKVTGGEDGEETNEKRFATGLTDGLTPEDTATLDSKKLLNESLDNEANDFATKELYRQFLKQKQIDETNAYELEQARLLEDAKFNLAGASLNLIGSLVDKQSIAGKGIAIAGVGIDTAKGIIKALATSPPPSPLGALGAVAVGIAGLTQTLAIAKQKIPSATGSGFVSGGNIGSSISTPPAPSFNLVAGTEGSQINDSINLQGQEPIKAVVVSGDVTSAQSVDRNIITESGI